MLHLRKKKDEGEGIRFKKKKPLKLQTIGYKIHSCRSVRVCSPFLFLLVLFSRYKLFYENREKKEHGLGSEIDITPKTRPTQMLL